MKCWLCSVLADGSDVDAIIFVQKLYVPTLCLITGRSFEEHPKRNSVSRCRHPLRHHKRQPTLLDTTSVACCLAPYNCSPKQTCKCQTAREGRPERNPQCLTICDAVHAMTNDGILRHLALHRIPLCNTFAPVDACRALTIRAEI